MRCCVVFLTLISWETWACNLVQSSQQGCVSPSKVTSATLVLALKVSQCPFQLSQAISSQKISVVLGNTGVRSVKLVVLPLVSGLPSGNQPQCNTPSISVNAQSFLQEHLQALGSATPGTRWIALPPRGTWGLEVILGALMLFSPSLEKAGPVGGGGWVPAALEHPWGYQGHQDIPCCGSALLLRCCLLTPIFRG